VKSIQASDELVRAADARDVLAVADRVEIEALRGEFVDALTMRDYDRCCRSRRRSLSRRR